MADAELEKTTVSIQSDKSQHTFVATGEVIKFDGFLKVYRETRDEDTEANDTESGLLPPLSIGETLNRKEVTATQRFSQHPPRYNEASLVKKLEELGIGRPSTYAPTISTIQQREYVTKGDKSGEEKEQTTLTLKQDQISESTKQTIIGAERNKLIPTDVGIVVNDFLLQFFPEIMDYNFTAEVEKRFDEVAEGKTEWTKLMQDFYQEFSPLVEKTLNVKSEHKVGERELGKDPKSGKPVFVKIGRFGPVVQIGSADDKEKPRFAQMKQGQSMETITLEEALDLFKLPRTLGEFEGTEVSVGAGRFGPYILHDKKYVSIPAGQDPLSITLDEAVTLIQVHIPPAVSHRRAVRLWPAGDPGCQLCLCSQYAGHRRLRRRSGGHCRRHDRGRHRGCAGGRVRQEDPPAVPAGHYRHGGVHHWPLPLPYRHQLHGRRHRQHL